MIMDVMKTNSDGFDSITDMLIKRYKMVAEAQVFLLMIVMALGFLLFIAFLCLFTQYYYTKRLRNEFTELRRRIDDTHISCDKN